MANKRLKACPFCGGKARYGAQLDLTNGKWIKWVWCTECYSCTGRSENRAEVTRAWNKRVEGTDDS